jgi:hypothetical protein
MGKLFKAPDLKGGITTSKYNNDMKVKAGTTIE